MDNLTSPFPNIFSGLWASGLVHAASQRDGLAFNHHFCIFADKGLSRGICKAKNTYYESGLYDRECGGLKESRQMTLVVDIYAWVYKIH